MSKSLSFKQFTLALEEFEETGNFPEQLSEEQVEQLNEIFQYLRSKLQYLRSKFGSKEGKETQATIGARQNSLNLVASKERSAKEKTFDAARLAELNKNIDNLLARARELNKRIAKNPQEQEEITKELENINNKVEITRGFINPKYKSPVPSVTARNKNAQERKANLAWSGTRNPETGYAFK